MEELTNLLIKFRNERDWEQFHNPKDLALALSIEASELNEAFLWKDAKEADINKVREELADIFAYGILLAHSYKLNIYDIVKEKIAINSIKYPVEKSKGSSKKYSDL